MFHIGDQKQGLLEGDGEIGLVQSHRRMTSRTFHWQVLLQFSFDPPPHLQGHHHRLVLKIKFNMSITDYDESERRKILPLNYGTSKMDDFQRNPSFFYTKENIF